MAGGDRRRTDRRKAHVTVQSERRRDNRRQAQRRAADRIALELWMEEVSGDDVYFRRTGNVGEGGVYFDNAIPHAVGTPVTLKFAIPGDPEMVVARGKVVSSARRDGLGMGIKFVNVEGDGHARIRSYIRRAATP